jgi:hypothetical protein
MINCVRLDSRNEAGSKQRRSADSVQPRTESIIQIEQLPLNEMNFRIAHQLAKFVLTFTFFAMSACSLAARGPQVHGQFSGFEPNSRASSFDCDTTAGRYTEVNAGTSAVNARVTGFMQVLTLNAAAAWPPDAGVIFAGPNKLPRVGLETFVLPDKPAVLQIAVRGAGGAGDHTVFASVPISDVKIPFTLRLSSSGQLALSVGDASTSLSVGPIDIMRMNLYCSSAHIHFSEVRLTAEN